MWEGGVIENLTVLNFFAASIVYLWASAISPSRSARRRWLILFALACFILVGEETNYGRGTIFLNLNDPDFMKRYNPQHDNLHNLAGPGFVSILGFFVLVAGLRFFGGFSRWLRLPIPQGFYNAVLLTGLGLSLMRFGDDRYLSIDEVYEWSSSFLLFCLALYFRNGWFFWDSSATDTD
jgi:hypothetical protein